MSQRASEAVIVCVEIQNVLAALREHKYVHVELPRKLGDSRKRPLRRASTGSKSLLENKSSAKVVAKEDTTGIEKATDLNATKGETFEGQYDKAKLVEGKTLEGHVEPESVGLSLLEDLCGQAEIDAIRHDLIVLREQMHKCTDWATFRASPGVFKVLQPFLKLISLHIVGAAPTSVALASVYRLMSFGLFDTDTAVNADSVCVKAVYAVVDSVIHCDFKQTDTGADEIAIMWILELLRHCVECDSGRFLTDQIVWNIISTMYQISVGKLNADMLRGMATRILGTILKALFSRIFNASANTEMPQYNYGMPVAQKSFKYFCTRIDPLGGEVWTAKESTVHCLELIVTVVEASIDSSTSYLRLVDSPALLAIVQDDLFRVVTQICQSPTKSRTYVSNGTAPQNKATGEFAVDGLGRTQQQVLTGALRLVTVLTLHQNMRQHLKPQLEVFFNSVYLRVLEGKVGSNDEARVVLESLLDLMADPSLVSDLYVNYDCDLHASNVFENLLNHLSRHTFPKRVLSPAFNGLQMLSLQCILYGIKAIADRCKERTSFAFEDCPQLHPKQLEIRRTAKSALEECVAEFNIKAQRGIQALTQAGVLDEPPDPAVFAKFLRRTQGLDKVAIGQFLGQDGEFNNAVLSQFVRTFQMKGLTLLQALRMFLETFRLPGEAQQIDRVLQCFAEMAHTECDAASALPSADCAYLLCFSIIMLNTDLHNPNIRQDRKMSFEQFLRNNKNYGQDTNKGIDLSVKLLKSIYDEIKGREINTMPDASSLTAEISTDRWRDLIASHGDPEADNQPWASTENLLGAYDEQMFSICWKPATASMSVIFDTADPVRQPVAMGAAQDGFIMCSRIAAFYNMTDVFDSIGTSLCKFTTLLMYPHSSNDEDVGVPADSSIVDSPRDQEDETKLGCHSGVMRALKRLERNTKAQVATVFAFALLLRYGEHMRSAWSHLIYCFLRLSDLDLLPAEVLVESEDEHIDVELRKNYHESVRMKLLKDAFDKARMEKEKADSGVGWFSSWLFGDGSTTDNILHSDEHYILLSCVRVADLSVGISRTQDTEAVNDSEPKATTAGPKQRRKNEVLECVRRCHLENLVSSSSKLGDEALTHLIHALIYGTGGRDTLISEAVPQVELEQRIEKLSLPSKSSRIFGLHLLTEVVLQNTSKLKLFWGIILVRYFEIIETAHAPSFLVEKATVGMLRIAATCIHLEGFSMVMLQVFERLLQVERSICPGLAVLIAQTLKSTVVRDCSFLGDKDPHIANGLWNRMATVLVLLSEKSDEAASIGFEISRYLVQESTVKTSVPIKFALSMLMPYVNRTVSVDVKEGNAEEALAVVFGLLTRIEESASRGSEVASNHLVLEREWVPLVEEISGVVRNVSKPAPIRFSALNLLKTALMGHHGDALSGKEWGLIVEQILFGLCECVLEDGKKDAVEIDESAMARAYGVMVLVADVAKRYKGIMKQDLSPEVFAALWTKLILLLEQFKTLFPDEFPIQLEQLKL